MQETRVLCLGQESPWRRAWQPSPVFLSGEWHAQRSLRGHSPPAHGSYGHTHFHGRKHIYVVVRLLPRVLTPGLSVKLKLCPHSTLRPCAVPSTSPGPLFSFPTVSVTKSFIWCNHAAFVLCIKHFTEQNVLKVHPCCSTIRISFLLRMNTFCYICIHTHTTHTHIYLRFVYLFIHQGALELFLPFGCYE